MALVKIFTTRDALQSDDMNRLAMVLGTLTYGAEGFSESDLAPALTWILADHMSAGSFLTAQGPSSAPLYLVEVTTLRHALDGVKKQVLGAQITDAILASEGLPSTPENASRVWVRFNDVADGDLIVAGQSASLAGLRALIAQERNSNV